MTFQHPFFATPPDWEAWQRRQDETRHLDWRDERVWNDPLSTTPHFARVKMPKRVPQAVSDERARRRIAKRYAKPTTRK